MANNTIDANNFTLSTDLNVGPYYDDFNAYKDFYRILYKPGMAVQARELTQMQTMFQKQIDRFGEHIFKEGSIVTGCAFNIDLKRPFVKLRDANYAAAAVTVGNFDGTLVTGATSGVKAYVLTSNTGSEAGAPDYKTIHVNYTASGTNTLASTFIVGERLNANTGFSANVISSNTGLGYGSSFTVGDGVIFAKEHFIRIAEQTIVLEKYSVTPSYRVGFNVVESIVTYNEDTSLNDPAQGSYNYAAPGADRLKLNAVLEKRALTANTANFAELFLIENGVIKSKAQTPQYSVIRDELARRTEDESGNYTVRGLDVIVREHLNSNTNNGVYYSDAGGNPLKLAAGVEPGKAYVKGYDYENLYTRYLDIDKGIDFIDIEQQTISANYGSYVYVNDVCGFWDVNTQPLVKLYSTAQNKVSGSSYSTGSASGAMIGTARARAIVYNSGTVNNPNAVYKLYLHDIKMSNGAFSATRAVLLDGVTTKGFADTVLVSNNTVLQETSFDTSVFILPAKAVKRIRDSAGNIDNSFQFYKYFDVTIASGGTFSIATGAVDETFPYSAGLLNNTQMLADMYVVTNATQHTASLTGTISVNSGSNTFNGLGTAFTTQLAVDDHIRIGGGTIYRIHSITSANTLIVTTQPGGNLASQVYVRTYYQGKIIDFTRTGATGTSRSVNITSATGATFDMKETLASTVSATAIVKLNKVDGQEKRKVLNADKYVKIRISTHPLTTTGPWTLGIPDVFNIVSVRRHTANFTTVSDGTDVTSYFTLNTGQTDTLYNHSSIVNSGGLTIASGDYLLVKLDYFAHDTSQGVGYFSVDSYPVDDISVANTSAITTKEIPRYTSPTSGILYDLRDSIDIRPSVTLTANSVSTLTNISQNPAESTTLATVTGGLHYMPPNSYMLADLSYYLSRKDLVTLNSRGDYKVIRGVPSKFPITPTAPDDSMTLSKIEVSPFPSLTTSIAQAYGRQDLSITLKKIENKRYTMRDIGVLENRINNLEYYVTLSLLEKDTKDLVVLDGNGLDRFKNGILVDSFTGHNIGNVYDVDYKIAIDPSLGEARPQFFLNNVELFFNAAVSSNYARSAADATITVASTTAFVIGESIYQGANFGAATAVGVLRRKSSTNLYLEQVTGTFAGATATKGNTSGGSSVSSAVALPTLSKLVTLPYTHETLIDQPYSTTARNPAGLFYRWKGVLTLNPDADYWVDTTQVPDVQVNFDNNKDNWVQNVGVWRTEWNNWQTNVTGTAGDRINEKR